MTVQLDNHGMYVLTLILSSTPAKPGHLIPSFLPMDDALYELKMYTVVSHSRRKLLEQPGLI